MDSKSVFNATVCLLGLLILLIHIVNLAIKKDKRKDENLLLQFFIFTAIHFAVYFIFDLVKLRYTSNAFIIASYTIFYIFNNIEVILFYRYLTNYTLIKNSLKKKLNLLSIILFVLFVISDFVNIFTHMYFKAVDGTYQRSTFMFISQGYEFIILLIAFIIAVTNKHLKRREKIAFTIYCLLPFFAIIIQILYPGYAIAYATLILSVEILFLFANVEKNIKIREEEKQLKETEIKTIVTQIQPNFVYNILSSISTLISINPRKAQKALDQFSNYLRVNFNSLTESKLVFFEDELKHIKTYFELEKIRYEEKINIIFDIKCSNFMLPPLTIQPLVENAVKHGISKKVDGGTLTLKTYETTNAFIVEVIDNGIGFDLNEDDFLSNKYAGISNVRRRITTLTKGDLSIESKPNRGTKVIVKFFK